MMLVTFSVDNSYTLAINSDLQVSQHFTKTENSIRPTILRYSSLILCQGFINKPDL